MINIGPRSGLVLSALTSVPGLMLAKAAWNSGIPDPATWNWSYSLVGVVLGDGVGEAEPELVEGEGDGAMPVRRIRQHGGGCLESVDRQRQHASGRRDHVHDEESGNSPNSGRGSRAPTP